MKNMNVKEFITYIITFESVDNAKDIYKLNNFKSITDSSNEIQIKKCIVIS